LYGDARHAAVSRKGEMMKYDADQIKARLSVFAGREAVKRIWLR
jgi:hypothetical protein